MSRPGLTAALNCVLLFGASELASVGAQPHHARCDRWQSLVIPGFVYEGVVPTPSEMSERDTIEAFECLLSLEGRREEAMEIAQ